MVIALLALLIIQAFQTAQLYDRKSNQFTLNLSSSLERIAIRHEKAEDIRRYMHIVNRDFSGQYKDILKEEFQSLLSTQESISIRDTSIFERGELQHYLVRHATVIVRHLHDCYRWLSVAVTTRELSVGWFIQKLETVTLLE